MQALRKAYVLPTLFFLNPTEDGVSNRKRLLHPGADTKLILSQYVATIKCLRIVDPPGVLLFKVADPIRRYLRSAHPNHHVNDHLSQATENDPTPSEASSPTS